MAIHTVEAAASVEHRSRQGLIVLAVLAIVLIGASEWLPSGLPFLITLLAGAVLIAVSGIWRLAGSTTWRLLLGFGGALLILAAGVSIAGAAVGDLYQHRAHGGDMDTETAGRWYRPAVFGLVLGIVSLFGAARFSGRIVEQSDYT